MKLIADSGSTKTQWYLIDTTHTQSFLTEGYNPYYNSSTYIKNGLVADLLPKLKQLTSSSIGTLSFYGAGCGTEANRLLLHQIFSDLFPNSSIEIGTDLLAAARATAAHEKGICCILGTGTNSCYYDGKKIIDNLPSLGYILGDEGAGVALGKQIVQAYFYREMPLELKSSLENSFNMDRHYILQEVLQGNTPSRFLASFAQFAVQHEKHPFIIKLIEQNFETFIVRHLYKYKVHGDLPIHFVGSIAFGFQEILIALLRKHQLKIGTILKTPFPQLLSY
jgi:N-acetylglucosamine kinase-like BadF-type ATPase